MKREHEGFDRALRSRSDRIESVPERAADAAFLRDLAVRCSPLFPLLPKLLLDQQAAAQEASHRAQHPRAMRRIVYLAGVRAGRIVIDWRAGRICHGVDIAVLPEQRSTGLGLHLLRAWLDVADAGGWIATLDVNRDNPALQLYLRLAFRIADEAAGDGPGPFLQMIRPPRSLPSERTAVSGASAGAGLCPTP